MCTIVLIYEFIIACFFFIDVNAESIDHIKHYITTKNPFTYDPTRVFQLSSRNYLEDTNVKELLDSLKKLRQTNMHITETTSSSISGMHEHYEAADSSNFKNDESSSKNLETELTILKTAYAKVSDRIRSVHDAIQKNFDVMIKLNILKGMLLEEHIRTRHGNNEKSSYLKKI